MSYNLHITSVAQRDISQAADYIEFVLKNPKAADDLLEETDQKINALLPFPAEHPVVEDRLLSSWGIRFIQCPKITVTGQGIQELLIDGR